MHSAMKFCWIFGDLWTNFWTKVPKGSSRHAFTSFRMKWSIWWCLSGWEKSGWSSDRTLRVDYIVTFQLWLLLVQDLHLLSIFVIRTYFSIMHTIIESRFCLHIFGLWSALLQSEYWIVSTFHYMCIWFKTTGNSMTEFHMQIACHICILLVQHMFCLTDSYVTVFLKMHCKQNTMFDQSTFL